MSTSSDRGGLGPSGSGVSPGRTVSPRASTDRDLESVESFRRRAREWIAGNLAPISDAADPGSADAADDRDEAERLHARRLQATLHQGGLAGICYPREHARLRPTPAPLRRLHHAT